MSIEDARALGVDVSVWQPSPTHIDIPVIWQEQQRRSQLSIDVEIESLVVSELLSPDPSCSPTAGVAWANTRVTFASDDGSITGTVEGPGFGPNIDRIHPVDLKLMLAQLTSGDASFEPPAMRVDLRGNLPLAVEPGRVPQEIRLEFYWYRMDPGPGDRIGIEFISHYSCPGVCVVGSPLATAWPVDGCLPWELPRDGACISLDPPPPVRPAPNDAGMDAGTIVPKLSDAGP